MKHIGWMILLLIACFLYVGTANAQTDEITIGLIWLANSQDQTGSWGNTENSLSTEYFSSVSVLDAFKVLGQNNTTTYQNAIQWLQLQEIENAAYIANRIYLLANTGLDQTYDINTLISYRNADNGWGGYLNFTSNNFHTLLALQALKAVNYPDQTILNKAISYLISNQNPDGGFGFYSGDDSNVYMTSLVSSTLQQFTKTTTIATAINKATAYLISHQNTDGGFGTGRQGEATSPLQSSVYETSLAYISLVNVITDNTVLNNAIVYLKSSQQTDGSWNDDPYSTALALSNKSIRKNYLTTAGRGDYIIPAKSHLT